MMKDQHNIYQLKKQPFLVLSLAIFILITSGGYLYYRYERNATRQEKYSDLKMIADLKMKQILQWREERLANAKILAESPFVRQNIQDWLLSKDKTFEADLLKHFLLMKSYYNYEDVFIVSDEGEFLLGHNTALQQIDKVTFNLCEKALPDGKIFMSEPYFCSTHNTIHLDIIAPVQNDKNVPVVILVLRVNPFDFLYPYIQSWPTSSKTAETLILRKEGDSILYVNDLRHTSNSALKLRIPLTRIDIPAVQAALGREGIWEGLDYRGVRVLADMRPVPGTSWFMVAKIDQSEIYSELKYISVIIIGIALLLFLFSGIGISWLYNNRQKNIYRNLLETGTALEESQEEFRATLYSIGDAVITTDIKGCIRNMNVVAEKLTGWTESDAAGRTIEEVFNIVNEESRDKVESPVQRVLKEGLAAGLANHILLISKDGKETPVADSGAPILNEKGDITGVVLVFRDQTQERMAQKALKEQRDFSESLIETAQTIIMVLDTRGRIVRFNPYMEKLSGYSLDEVRGKDWFGIFLTPELSHTIKPLFQNAVNDIATIGNVNPIISKDGRTIIVDWNDKTLKDKDGHTVGLLAIGQDITERIAVESEVRKLNSELEQRVIQRTEQLEAANKELEAFSYSVSHDLRAPLRAVDSYTNILLEDYEKILDDEGKRICGIISSGAKQMGELIDELLNFSKIGRSSLDASLLDMKSIASISFAEIASENEKARTNLKIGKLQNAYGDAHLIKLVWNNLISNAIKYSSKKEKSEISIGSHSSGNNITYYVKDNGVGFDMLYKHKLFGVFQRLHSGKDFEGNGVGLAIVQRIINRHGGKVWAEGEVDKGATFYFSLPVNGTGF